MRNRSYALIALALFVQFSCGPTHVVVESPAPAPPPPAPAPAPEVSYQNFYDALSPYGEWINNPDYGYVWMPNVGPDFRPYATNGNWVYTEEGWAWSSNYSWGWAPFHYGRWFYEDGYGWMWMPGNEWAPAWVTWRRSSDYYGWAPLAPSVSITVAASGGYNPPPHYWSFVPHQYVTSPHINNYYVNEQQKVTIINNTTVIHNTTIVNNTHVTVNNYAGGPDPVEVARVTGAPLRPVPVRESNTPAGNSGGGAFAVYRPRINAAPQGSGGNGGSSFHPAHVQTLTNVRPVNTAVYNNPPNRQPVASPTAQPANQPAYPPSNTQPANRPAYQPSSAQPANRPAYAPSNTQPANNPAYPPSSTQPANRPAYQPTNAPANQPSSQPPPVHAATVPAPAAPTPAVAKPAPVTPATVKPGNGNGRPGMPATGGNPPKPRNQQGPKNPPKTNKPKPTNPDNKP